jgi:flagellar hook-associated protein 2
LDLLDVDKKVESLTERYKKQFSAMESAVTSLKSTGDYLTNMMEAWKDDN